MTSLVHDIEGRILALGGSDITIRAVGCGSGKLAISFMYRGEPRSALMKMPSKRQGESLRRAAAKDAITKAIR